MDVDVQDVLIVGAGVAGLAALRTLDRAGLSVLCVEARERIGGRIFTVRDSFSPLPIELGAEFIHGRPAELWNIVNAASLAAYDCAEHAVQLKNGHAGSGGDAWSRIGDVMKDLQKAAKNQPDISFAQFLDGTSHPPEAKDVATAYVEGFNAARAEVIGIASLAQDAAAADAIGGDHSFRIANGYDAVPTYLVNGISNAGARIRLNSVVDRIRWQKGVASVDIRSTLTGQQSRLQAHRVVTTVPLGVLQANTGDEGAIRFEPDPPGILEAARQLKFGHVVRTVLRFRDRVLEEKPDLADAGFLFSREPVFPTWWTTLPVRAPIVTGWSSGPKADLLAGQSKAAIIARALKQFARITGLSPELLQESFAAAYFHDWQADPYSRGAYSYTPAGTLPARAVLAEPVQETLFFAGEATETNGHSGTVHGAIATGFRAARQVLESLR
jgi:monoamine oxidase